MKVIPETAVRRQEESKNSVYLFVFCMNLGEINIGLNTFFPEFIYV
jgi:hypothetical protein